MLEGRIWFLGSPLAATLGWKVEGYGAEFPLGGAEPRCCTGRLRRR